jgi:hypothetical protein
VLVLTGAASLADRQAELDAITASSSLREPTNSGKAPSRTVSFTVNDGHQNSDVVAPMVGGDGFDPAHPPSLPDAF